MYSDWYRKLKKPAWAPEDRVFGQVWSVLYIIILLVNVYIAVLILNGDADWTIGLPFWLNLLFNLMFTPIQFGLKNNLLALVDIVLVLLTILWGVVIIWPVNYFVSIAYAPYLAWVCIATTLQGSISWLNRKRTSR